MALYFNILNLWSESRVIEVMDDLFEAKAEVENFRINITHPHAIQAAGFFAAFSFGRFSYVCVHDIVNWVMLNKW